MLWPTIALWSCVALCGGWYAGYMAHDHLRPEIQRTGWFKAIALAGFVFGLVLVPLAAWGHTKSGMMVLVSLGGYVTLTFLTSIITARSIEANRHRSRPAGTRVQVPSLAEIEKVDAEVLGKLLSAFLSLDENWGQVWIPGALGGSPSSELNERHTHLLASFITLGELAALASAGTVKLPASSEWEPLGLTQDMVQFVSYVARQSPVPEPVSPNSIVAVAQLDQQGVEARVRDCYEWVQSHCGTQSPVNYDQVLGGLVAYMVRPLNDGKLAGRWHGDMEVKTQVARHMIERTWQPILSRLRQLRRGRGPQNW